LSLTAAQICALAQQDAKCPGYSAQAGQFLNMILGDLCRTYDFELAAKTQYFNFNPGLIAPLGNSIYGSGPYPLNADFLRMRDDKSAYWTLPGTGVVYPLIPCDLSEFDMMVQQAGTQSYPYIIATDMSLGDETQQGDTTPVCYVYAPPSGAYPVTIRYFAQMPDIATPESSSTVPWFPHQGYLRKALAACLMGITDDARQPSWEQQGRRHVAPVSEPEGQPQQPGLDREARSPPLRTFLFCSSEHEAGRLGGSTCDVGWYCRLYRSVHLMPIRNAKAVVFRPHGLSDAVDGTNAFSGALAIASNLIPSNDTADSWVPRPAAVQLSAFAGFTTPGFVSASLVVGDIEYGLIASGRNAGKDEPYAYNIRTGAFLTVTGILAANCPTSPPTSGAWTPPILAVVGNRVIVCHPGFAGGAVKFGWFDVSSFTATISTTTNSTTTLASATNMLQAGVQPGQTISKADVPAGTTVVSIATNGLSLVMFRRGDRGVDQQRHHRRGHRRLPPVGRRGHQY
jgi:hypothetical protein